MNIFVTWDGMGFMPLWRFKRHCEQHFVVGRTYVIDPQYGRSQKSHRHFFAAIKTAWENLPELLHDEFPTPEHLRKHALIRCGYEVRRPVMCKDQEQAALLAGYISTFDEYAIVTVEDALVTIHTARSVSEREMGGAQFQKMKNDVLEFVAHLAGVTVADLNKNAGQAA